MNFYLSLIIKRYAMNVNCKFHACIRDKKVIRVSSLSETDKLFDNKYDANINMSDINTCQKPSKFLEDEQCLEYIFEHIGEAKARYEVENDELVAVIPFTKKNFIEIALSKKVEGSEIILINELEYEPVFEFYYPNWNSYEELLSSPVGEYIKIFDKMRALEYFSKDKRQENKNSEVIQGRVVKFRYFMEHHPFKNDPNCQNSLWQEIITKHKNNYPHEKILERTHGSNNFRLSYPTILIIKMILDGWLYQNQKLVAWREPKIQLEATDTYCRVVVLRCKEYVTEYQCNSYGDALSIGHDPQQKLDFWKVKIDGFNLIGRDSSVPRFRYHC